MFAPLSSQIIFSLSRAKMEGAMLDQAGGNFVLFAVTGLVAIAVVVSIWSLSADESRAKGHPSPAAVFKSLVRR